MTSWDRTIPVDDEASFTRTEVVMMMIASAVAWTIEALARVRASRSRRIAG